MGWGGGRGSAVGLIGGAATLLATSGARAQDAVLDSGDTAWMLTATALVLMMTIPGLAMFYGGMVRKKNVLAMSMQSSPPAASPPWSGWRRATAWRSAAKDPISAGWSACSCAAWAPTR